jgi:transporter family-2 protein
VAGQLVCSLGLDHFGAMGVPQQPLTVGRAAGAAMIVAGMLLVKYL